jgi:capsular exopolysaccharide synthesis family protein
MFADVQQDPDAFNLERTLSVLRRRAPLIIVCILVAAGAAYGYSKHETKKYTASASLAFNGNTLSQQIAGFSATAPNNSSSLLAQEATNVELVKNRSAAAATASILQHGLTERLVIESLSIAGEGETQVVGVSSTTTSPVVSAAIANTYAAQFVKQQNIATVRYLKSALAVVRKQLAALTPEQRIGPDGLNLQNRAQGLSLLSELKADGVTVASEAAAPSSPSSPKTSRNTALGAFLGLIVGLALVLLLERLDRRIVGPDELEAIYRAPLLGAIPHTAALARSARERGPKRAPLPSNEAEGFSLIRARLRFLNVNRDLNTIMITSAEAGDGKSMIARHLAEAAARLGSRVLLLEADLRNPCLAPQLGVETGPGLADVLIGAISIDEATRSVELEVAPSEGAEGRRLDVLPAGAVLPPNPGELLESRAVDAVLEWARSAYDLVVIDTPPLMVVSDAFPLLTKVDGIVIVGRVERSQRNAAERLHQVLASSGAPLLGVVANGSQSAGPSVYAYSVDGKSSVASPSSIVAPSSSEELVSSRRW